MEAIPVCFHLEIVIIKVSMKHSEFIVIRMATCFDPIGSSSGLHHEPVNYKAAHVLGIQNNIYK